MTIYFNSVPWMKLVLILFHVVGDANLSFIPFRACGPYLFVPSQARVILYDADKLLPGAPPKPKDQLKGHKDTIQAMAVYK